MKTTTKKNATNAIRYIDDNHALVTQAFAKKAVIFGTPEFDQWRAYKAIFKDAKMVTKKIKKKSDKKNPKISYHRMRAFIKLVGTKEDMEALENQIALSKITPNPYQTVLNWFMNYPKYEAYQSFAKKLDEKVAAKKAEEAKKKAEEAANEYAEFNFDLDDLDLEIESEEESEEE